MFERFDSSARDVVIVAGELARRRHQERTGQEGFVTGVVLTVSDMREALRLLCPDEGWAGRHDQRLTRRLNRLRSTTGPIAAKDLKRVLL